MDNKIEIPLTETAYLVLLAMVKPNHGYGVMQFVEERTNGRVIFGPGTLYGAINNLAKKRWIKPYNENSNDRKKEYVTTDLGMLQLKEETGRLKEVYTIGTDILGEVK